MKKRPDLNILSRDVFEANKAKGFHNENNNDAHYLMLVITELSEAVEAHRKGKFADTNTYKRCIEDSENLGYDCMEYKLCVFKHHIKDTLEDELADAIIRLLDLAGLRKYVFRDAILTSEIVKKEITFTENIFEICKSLIYYKYSMIERIYFSILNIEFLSKEIMGIDIWEHVELKLWYNTTREKMHGKKY